MFREMEQLPLDGQSDVTEAILISSLLEPGIIMSKINFMKNGN